MRLTVLFLVLFVLVGCSEGGKPSQQSTSEPTVSTPADATPTAAPVSSDFATAIEFTKLAHKEKYGKAAELAFPESPAARYLAHQTLMHKAERINGITPLDHQNSFKPDPTKGTIKITDNSNTELSIARAPG